MKVYISLMCLWILIHGTITDARRKNLKARGPNQLIHSLMRDYSDLFRPHNGANATDITMGLDLQDVVSLREGTLESTVVFVAWIKMNWTDPRLSWDPDQYRIRAIRLTPSKLWTPDVKLLNSLDPSPNMDWRADMMISFDGTVRGRMPITLPVHCGRPRDPHASWECRLIFRSWTYTVDDMNLQLERNESNVHNYNDRVWRITGNEAKRRVVSDECCPERYASLLYVIRLIRH